MVRNDPVLSMQTDRPSWFFLGRPCHIGMKVSFIVKRRESPQHYENLEQHTVIINIDDDDSDYYTVK